MGKYFGTDGFRGEANVTLTAKHAYEIGRFIGWYFKNEYKKSGKTENPRILIGKDTRRSSYMFEYNIIAGMIASGADAYMMHVTTTPSVAYITKVDGFDCGIMISASHNPFYDNGIKLINHSGEKMNDEFIDKLELYLDKKFEVDGEVFTDLPYAKREEIGKTIDYVSGRNRYVGYLISLGQFSFKGKKVGLDCANGSSWNIAKSVFDALGATTFVINADPNGMNINENAGSTHIEGLQELVRKNNLDVGFAYDGDADRCICVDENGDVVDGDSILYICGKYMKERGELDNNVVVTTVMSNFGLYKALKENDIDYVQTKVGDKYVYEHMSSHGNKIGGEQSGHIIFSKYATTGDGILTSLKVMEVLMDKKTTLSKLSAGLVKYPQELVNVPVSDKEKVMSDGAVAAEIERVQKMLGSDGRVLVRPSGTEPVVRVMVEASSIDDCKKFVQMIEKVISSVK